MAALILGLELPEDYHQHVGYTSSFIFEFYQRDFHFDQDVYPYYDPKHYYLKVYLDDRPLNITGAKCDADYKCPWESVVSYL